MTWNMEQGFEKDGQGYLFSPQEEPQGEIPQDDTDKLRVMMADLSDRELTWLAISRLKEVDAATVTDEGFRMEAMIALRMLYLRLHGE